MGLHWQLWKKLGKGIQCAHPPHLFRSSPTHPLHDLCLPLLLLLPSGPRLGLPAGSGPHWGKGCTWGPSSQGHPSELQPSLAWPRLLSSELETVPGAWAPFMGVEDPLGAALFSLATSPPPPFLELRQR